jgi:hypothetical protein
MVFVSDTSCELHFIYCQRKNKYDIWSRQRLRLGSHRSNECEIGNSRPAEVLSELEITR